MIYLKITWILFYVSFYRPEFVSLPDEQLVITWETNSIRSFNSSD